MKIIELDGQTFIRIGSRTLSPVDAVQHLNGLVAEARQLLDEAGFARDRVRQKFSIALETGQAFDRAELVSADQRVERNKTVLDAALAELTECRHLVSIHRAKVRVSSSQAELDRLLTQYPAEAA